MNIRNSLKALTEFAHKALTQRPFGEFFVLATLVIGLQHAYTSFTASSDVTPASLPAHIAAATPAAKADSASAALPQVISATSPLSVAMVADTREASLDQSPIEQIPVDVDKLVDTINDSTAWVHRLLNYARVEQPTLKALQFGAADDSADAKFRFASALNQPLFEAISNVAFAVGSINIQPQGHEEKKPSTESASSKLDFWHINGQFAFDKQRSQAKRQAAVKTKDKFVIMLDPGHGGSDPGSIGHNGLQEKVLTLDIAKRAERILEKQHNINVLLTRDSDKGMSRKSRVQRVKNSNADMIVSLHLNHLPQTDVNLVETFYAAPHNIQESIEKQQAARKGFLKTNAQRPDFSFTNGSKTLASLMQKNVYEEVIQTNPDTDNAGVKQDTLYILTRSFTPGVLIELSCLSNIQEAERLSEPAYRQRLAEALARGVREYLKTPAAKNQFGPEV